MAPTAESVSDPSSPDYNPRSPLYDVTADSSSKYYVGPLKTDNTPSGDEIRAMATQQIDDEIRAGWLGPAVDPVLRDKKIQELYQQHLDDAKHGLDEGLTMRENGGAPRTLWSNASHEQMNDAITQDANPATVAETSEEWVAVGNDLGTHQKTLGDAINASTSNWQGDAGDAVREHLAGVGKWLGATAQGATLAGRQQEIHSQALNETQRQMAANPPVQFDLQSTNQRLMSMTDPVQYAAAAGEAMQTYRAQTAARDHAAQIMTQYDDTIGGAVATPRFPAPPKLPSATARSATSPASGGAGADGAQPLMARRAMDQASARIPAEGTTSGLDGVNGPGGSGAGAPGSGIPGSGIPGDGSGAGGSGFSGSGIPGGGSGAGGSGFSGAGIPAASGGGGAGGAGAGGSGFSGAGIPEIPGGGSFSGAGIPGSSMPVGGDSTTSSGFTPSGIPGGGGPGGGSGFTPGSIPGIPDTSGGGGGGIRGGGIPGFTSPGIDPITGLPTGTGPGGIPGGGIGTGKMPTIGRGGGINGESIASRLGGIGGGGAGGGSLGGIGGGGSGAGGVGGGVRGTGAGSLGGGAASGAAAEAEAAAMRNAGGAGKAGAAGSPGMGGMGAGARGGKKEDDKEHKAADYLESDDPNFFAGEEAVAPPVIGDWKNQDWK
ncbi:hypothetical protein QRX60_40410 [Amycolatopsis mongoliensis]|uniref:PPE family domain-containing protein n=1 Tax=Amycolatopsis mongoliensis TaxID=715475 RepID=A0A9Y2JMW8_9PSEU|nr:hypothetical protein [Amycolatopsis sp. 4-36]WIY00264.1 hypothetical protein QRX60_40410 [Amycolatopsis sp. 4-36]